MKKMFHKVGYVVFEVLTAMSVMLLIATLILLLVNPVNCYVWFLVALCLMGISAICFDISRKFGCEMKQDRKDRRDRYYSLQKG